MQEPIICRFCLESLECFNILGDVERNMLDNILPEININPLDDFYICQICTRHLLESYQFKISCLEANANVEGLIKPKIISLESIEHILLDKKTSECLLKGEDDLETCSICLKAMETEACNSLIPSEILREMVEKCLPELDDNITSLTVCENCTCSLENMFSFINILLETEEKLKSYCIKNGINHDRCINLYEVKFAKVEMEDIKDQMEACIDSNSCSSLIKIEPKYECDDYFIEEPSRPGQNAKFKISSTMEFYEQALLLMLLIRRRHANKKKRRRFWVDPLGAERFNKGMYYNLYKELREDGDRFFEYFGLSRQSFDELLSIIKEDISGKDTVMRRCIPAEEKLALTLRYLVTGCSMKYLHYDFRLGVSTISLVVHQVCTAVWHHMRNICIPIPTEQRWLDIAEAFENDLNFPNCLGAIDAKDIRVMKLRHKGSLFLLAICDSKYCFTYIEVGNSDLVTLRESLLHKKFLDNLLNIPHPRPLRGSNITTPFVFVGGKGFTIAKYLMRPYSGRNPTIKKKIFNYHLSRARRPIDSAFAIFSSKWKIFHRPLDVSLDFAEDIIRTCGVLHNFILNRDGYNFEHTLMIEGLAQLHGYSRQGGKIANSIRDELANYFLTSEGEIVGQRM